MNVVELDTTPYLHLKMRELRSLCNIKKITIGSRPTKIQLQELLAEFEKANPSDDDITEEEISDLEANVPPPVLNRENRTPQVLSPTVLVRNGESLTGGSHISEITEDALSEDYLMLARMAKRLALERQLLAIERERQEMGLGPINGGSNINRVRDSPDMLKIPKGIVTKFEDGDDITKWFTAFERACVTRKVNRSHWGALLWEMFTGKCRDRLLTHSGKDAESYDLMKGTLIEGFGFSTEEYRIRFRGAQKSSSQTWVDFVDYSVKTLDGWIQGSGVSNYDGLYREVPQKGVGFSPFELLFGHPVRGPLALVKEGWERPLHEPKQDIVDYVLGLRSRMAEYMEKATKNLEASQQLQKFWYDQKAALVEFQPGQKVWVLEPVAPRALQDKWSGPYPVLERKSQVTYLVDLGTSRSPKRVIHVNRLKLFHDRADVNLLMVTDEDQEAESEPLPDLLSSDPKDGTVDGVIYSDTLSGQQQADCRRVLQQFPELFSLTPGQTHLCTHDVDTGDSMPVKNKIFRQSDHVKESIKVEVHKMLELGVIERSDSPWASPVVLVPKPHTKDGKKEMRFCVDYRGLNSVTKTDAHPIPRADELIDKLGAAKFLSTFDLTAGYWQIKMAPGAKEKTAFSTPDGHYQFTVMPFGLKNAPATFQRLVNQVLAGLESFSTAYLDDIAVFSSTWQDHLVHLKKVLKALQSAGLSIKASKCQIGQGTVVYLGHLVGGGQVQPLQPKIQTILDWVAPKTQTQVRAFLGLTGYYRRFVKGYGSIVTALTELTSKKMPKKVNWTVECQQAFDTLKQAMCSAPVLKAPDYSKQFIVQTDASEHGIGAVLSQTNDDGLDQPVAFISRRLLPREQRWSAIEREAFAVVWSLKKLRPYLFGTHFLVQTDHRPLKWLMQMKGENPKLLRWSISLQGMDFIVEHRPGTAHANADGLSRFFHLENEDSLGKG
ncbi:hypothetical protein NDU88_005787 [Pleurodeles waltl]|uniref:ribonuclease H n=1 Tax=Pleurodeles waltl TaxID=8319 RepID=A0AAV7L3J8_PLEWA|nr:hypothetical protein NDU88_005787 [Pleurodeles waltl]